MALSFKFKGHDGWLQLVSAIFSLLYSSYALVCLFVLTKRKKTGLVNYISWVILIVVTVLELVFLISLLLQANHYQLVRTSYGIKMLEYLHSKTQVIVLFITGLVGIICLLVNAVSIQRYTIAFYGKIHNSLIV